MEPPVVLGNGVCKDTDGTTADVAIIMTGKYILPRLLYDTYPCAYLLDWMAVLYEQRYVHGWKEVWGVNEVIAQGVHRRILVAINMHTNQCILYIHDLLLLATAPLPRKEGVGIVREHEVRM